MLNFPEFSPIPENRSSNICTFLFAAAIVGVLRPTSIIKPFLFSQFCEKPLETQFIHRTHAFKCQLAFPKFPVLCQES